MKRLFKKTQPSPTKLTKQQQESKHVKHVMFSYNWTDSMKVAHKVCDRLGDKNYPIWIDRDEMKGDLYGQMAYAVENAYLILMFMSPKYETSVNCEREASYAQTLGKRIIPVFTQKNYKPSGICGLIAAGKIYVDFSEASFDEKFQELLKQLGDPVQHDDIDQIPNSLPADLMKLEIDQSTKSTTVDDVYIALYDFEAKKLKYLSFEAGDIMKLVDDIKANWLLACFLYPRSSNAEGYIPSNFVTAINWYFGVMEESEADRVLMLPPNNLSSFLVREDEKLQGRLVLSVRCKFEVKHYVIHKVDNGGYFIDEGLKFKTLLKLVEHYEINADGLCTQLGIPCIKGKTSRTVESPHDPVDKWEIDRCSLSFGKIINRSTFGAMFEGRLNNTTKVAINTLNTNTLGEKDFLKEAQLMKKLIHPKLVRLYGVCTQDEPPYIVTELMINGTLQVYLQGDSNKLPLKTLIDMGAQIAEGMVYLGNNKYIHGDLAARSILVGENNACKIANFIFTRFAQNDSYNLKRSERFPIRWAATEVLSTFTVTNKSDVWSFGILLTELISKGEEPYPDMTNAQVKDLVCLGYRMPKHPNCPDTLYKIMLDCWNDSPHKRPSFDILQQKLNNICSNNDGIDNNLQLAKTSMTVESPHDPLDKWEIDRCSLSFEKLIKTSTFGAMFEGIWNKSTKVAINTLKPNTLDKKDFLKEAQLMKKLIHPKLVRLYGVCTQDEPPCIVTELMINGTLQVYLQGGGNKLPLKTLIDMGAQIAEGMVYLGNNKYIHRDLAARSILVGENNTCKIANFKLTQFAQNGSYVIKNGEKFPIKWTALEVFSTFTVTNKSDVWSFGILLTELINKGNVPYPGMRNAQVEDQVCGGYRMPKHPNCPDTLYKIMLDCWSDNPHKRPSFEILQQKLNTICSNNDGLDNV